MRVCFDSQIFGVQEYGGISRYFAGIAAEMSGIPDVDVSIVAPMHINAYLDRLSKAMVIGAKARNVPAISLPRRLGGAIACHFIQRKMQPDIVHKTYYHSFPGTPSAARTAVTVYDMIQERFPEDFPPGNIISRLKGVAVRRADHVFCISEHTKRDLLSTHPLDESRVSVTLLGFDSMRDVPVTVDATTFRTRVFGSNRPYILFVGRRPGYKNFDGLIRAFSSSRGLRERFSILCFGGGRFEKNEVARMSKLGVVEDVKHLSGGDEVLATCYRYASVFVFPSMYEGFGIPPLEAMSVECPVVCSNSSSIPEVVGTAGAFFNPADPESIRSTLERVLDSTDERLALVCRGLERCSMFSWRKCAEDTLAGYRAMVAQ